MEQFVGLDVSQKLTHVCVVDQKGSVVWRGTCLSTPEDIAATVRAKAPDAVRIGLETGPLSTWHWHALKAMGLPVICVDARHAKAALSMQINKTDKNDAEGLAQIMRTGWYREVGVKSLDNHKIRAVLGARAQLVGMQTDLKNQIRGLLKVFGTVLQRGHSQSFEQQVIAASQGNDLLDASVRSLLAALKTVGEQVAKLDRLVIKQAKQNGPDPTVILLANSTFAQCSHEVRPELGWMGGFRGHIAAFCLRLSAQRRIRQQYQQSCHQPPNRFREGL